VAAEEITLTFKKGNPTKHAQRFDQVGGKEHTGDYENGFYFAKNKPHASEEELEVVIRPRAK
jgi:hypothetical protein